jgi:hypothetical protein
VRADFCARCRWKLQLCYAPLCIRSFVNFAIGRGGLLQCLAPVGMHDTVALRMCYVYIHHLRHNLRKNQLVSDARSRAAFPLSAHLFHAPKWMASLQPQQFRRRIEFWAKLHQKAFAHFASLLEDSFQSHCHEQMRRLVLHMAQFGILENDQHAAIVRRCP